MPRPRHLRHPACHPCRQTSRPVRAGAHGMDAMPRSQGMASISSCAPGTTSIRPNGSLESPPWQRSLRTPMQIDGKPVVMERSAGQQDGAPRYENTQYIAMFKSRRDGTIIPSSDEGNDKGIWIFLGRHLRASARPTQGTSVFKLNKCDWLPLSRATWLI